MEWGGIGESEISLGVVAPLVGVTKKALRRPGTSGLIAGGGPAPSDLTARYEDVRTRLDGLSILHSFRVSVAVSRGAAIKRYPRRSPVECRIQPLIVRAGSSTEAN